MKFAKGNIVTVSFIVLFTAIIICVGMLLVFSSTVQLSDLPFVLLK